MPKIYHTITPDATYTFLTKESHDESKTNDDGRPASTENGFVYAESEVSTEEFERLQSWHIEGDSEMGTLGTHVPDEEDDVDPTIGDM